MRLSGLLLRNLAYYWRTNLAVVAGVAIAAAVLSGALLVGSSVRGSLRSLIFQRLGATEHVVAADRFFREELAGAFVRRGEGSTTPVSCPIIYLQGVVIHETTGRRALGVNVYGVDDRFWKFHGADAQKGPEGRSALVGEALARSLGIRPGGPLLIRLETQQGIPKESLYGRRENAGRTVRLTCTEILPAERLGEFALRPGQGEVHSVFVPLQRLQRDLAQPARANTVLLAQGSQGSDLQKIQDLLRSDFTLEDVGVHLRSLPSLSAIAVESTRVLLDDSIAQSASEAAAEAGMKSSGVFSYLANAIRAGGREIPYSVITAADFGKGALTSIPATGSSSKQPNPVESKDAIWLNEWAQRDLGIGPGAPVEVDYYSWQEEGRLVTRTARFRLAGVVAPGGDADSALAPDFPGIARARSIRAWDPPFPLDLRRIRPKDEEYWNRFRAAPKAFVTLARGQELWRSRFGNLTSVRLVLPKGADLEQAREKLAGELRRRIDPELSGFAVSEVRKRGLIASRGSTDFGEYFIYFSFFLIAAAVLLCALFFRLGVEQRVREIGTLRAVGFSIGSLQRVFLLEGAILSFCGSLLGLFGAVGYGGLLIFGLRNWWVDAVGTQRLNLHLSWADLAIGAGAGICASFAAIAWTLLGLRRNSTRALLAGFPGPHFIRRRRAFALWSVAAAAMLSAALMLLGSALRKIPDVAAFFGAGLMLLTAILNLAALYLRRDRPSPISGKGWWAYFRLGTRNATHRPGRSLSCIALIAAATFIIVSLEAFRRDAQSVSLEPKSGTGGYALVADSALPIIYDPNSSAGREALGIPEPEVPELAQVNFVPFRVRPGDDASCLNLYAPQEPRILGAPHSFIAAARFSFQDSLAATHEQRENPWLLLETSSSDGTIPAIGDANTIQYILHLSLGRVLTVPGKGGAPLRLRLVAALRDSILQGEIVISESNFLRAFPDREGYRFFLLDVPPASAASLFAPLMERLADWGFNLEFSRERLAAYHRVENTYLSTFQSLGALGLILGTAGLATVLLRNVLERRQELALLRAVGYRRQVLAAIVVAENAILMICGLACGTTCAALAIQPALHARGNPFPAAMVGLILLLVLLTGLVSSTLAVAAVFRSPLLGALQSE